MNLENHYDAAIRAGEIRDDPAQRQVLQAFMKLAEALSKKTSSSWFSFKKELPSKGIYLYGPVGVGKTYVMDLFFDSLELKEKARFHFHYFMQQVDEQLRSLQGQVDPLKKIAQQLAKNYRLLCFDEFLVNDVAHAMILAEFLKAIFTENIILVATSNLQPDALYLHGVQRARFLPAISLIKEHCEILSLLEKKDYRQGRDQLPQTYFYPLNSQTTALFAQQFALLAPLAQSEAIEIVKRFIPTIKVDFAAQAVWFDFKVICNIPRSQLDYLEIAERFESVFISNISQLGEKDTLAVILFIHLVDIFYDRAIRLILLAEVPLDALYPEGEMLIPFKRTLSRLQEMQAADYLSRHKKKNLSHF